MLIDQEHVPWLLLLIGHSYNGDDVSLLTRDSHSGVRPALVTRDSHSDSNWPVCIHVIRILALIGGSLRFSQNGRTKDMLVMICYYCYCSDFC